MRLFSRPDQIGGGFRSNRKQPRLDLAFRDTSY
jgi:hypothetical protein